VAKRKRFFPVARKRRELARTHPELNPRLRDDVLAHILARYPRLVITSTTGGKHSANSHHHRGNAADLAVLFAGLSSGEIVAAKHYMARVARWISGNPKFVSRLTEGIFNPPGGLAHKGLSVKNGLKQAGSAFWGQTTWEAHDDHLHLAKI
jgi:hypothetical protein